MLLEHLVIGESDPDFASRMIQRNQTRVHGRPVNFSHAAILLNGRELWHSTGSGIHKTTLAAMLAEKPCVIRGRVAFKLTRDQASFVRGYMARANDTRYPGLLTMLPFVFPLMRTVPWMDNGRAAACCSEFTSDVLKDCLMAWHGLEHPDLNDTDWCTPFTADKVAQHLAETCGLGTVLIRSA